MGGLLHFTLDDYDLIIDATASSQVTQRIERDLVGTKLVMPLVALTISASANHGCAIVRMPDFQGGPHALIRQAKLEIMGRHPNHPIVEAFWPQQRATKLFQPEPGCSEPTFIGSAADIDYHASALLNVAVSRLGKLASTEAAMDLLTAPWVLREPLEASHLFCTLVGNETSLERNHGYIVRVSGEAEKGMTAYMRRIARVESRHFETGGLIFGEIDDSHRAIWIDSVSGPPPDSESSPERFLCGTSGTKELARVRSVRSGGSSRFVGIWHTHPVSFGRPSTDDLTAMLALLHGQENPPRQVVMLIVGTSATAPVFNYYLYKRDQFRIMLVEAHDLKESQ
jgi:proteasome lid subunit RPN8/RPN11